MTFKMTKLPKDLEAIKFKTAENYYNDPAYCFTAGATAVLEHEQIKKLVEALEYVSDASCDNALAEFRAWREGK